jgi:predicted transcriptional regulator
MRLVLLMAVFFLIPGNMLAEDSETSIQIKVFWGLLGSYPAEDSLNPYKLTRDDSSVDVASILYSIRRDFKTIDEISSETGIPRDKITRKLEQLARCELVRRENEAFIVNFPFFDKPMRDRMNELAFEITEPIAEVVRSVIPELKKSVAVSSLAQQGYSWEDVALIIVGGLLLDTGLNDRGLRNWEIFNPLRDTPKRPGGYRYWYRAVEGGWGPYWKFGQNLKPMDEKNIWFCHFYGQVKGRRMNWERRWDTFDPRSPSIMALLIRHGRLAVNEVELPDPYSDSLDSTLRQLTEAGVIKVIGDTVYPGFPIFQGEDIKTTLKYVDQVCTRIIDSIYVPFVPRLEQEWENMVPENWEIPQVEKLFVRQVFSRPYNLVLHVLIEEGILPPAPIEPPFMYYGIRGNFNVL